LGTHTGFPQPPLVALLSANYGDQAVGVASSSSARTP
jgi:hypothetical protein